MKKFTLTFSLCCALGTAAFAGETDSSKDKEVMQQAPPVCDWYRAHEWDFDLWGTYAMPGNTGRHDVEFIDDFPTLVEHHTASNDRFIDRDGAWGGGADVKYFFSKYWALGIEGFVVDSNINSGGGGIGTFTLRYPIGCSRFAPYAWAGFGVVAGGGHHDDRYGTFLGGTVAPVIFTFNDREDIENKHAEATGQFGTGFEVRITRHVGVMTDFAWNLVSGPDNNFGMWRFGATLSY